MRTPISKNDLPEDSKESDKDGYLEQIIKYIPTEIVAFYAASFAAITAALVAKPEYWTVVWIVFIIALIGSIFSSAVLTKKDLEEKQIKEYVNQKIFRKSLVAAIAFSLWAFALGGPFEHTFSSWYNQVYGTLAIGVFAIFVPKLYEIVPFFKSSFSSAT